MSDTTKTKAADSAVLYKTTVSAGLLAYLYLLLLQIAPPTPARDSLLNPLKNFINYISLNQGYSMFKAIVTRNEDLGAEIVFADGTSTYWSYPDMAKANLWDKLFVEHYRKYSENFLQSTKGSLRQQLAYYLARKYDCPGHKVSEVRLVKHWAPTPPPPAGFGRPLPPHYMSDLIFDYRTGM